MTASTSFSNPSNNSSICLPSSSSSSSPSSSSLSLCDGSGCPDHPPPFKRPKQRKFRIVPILREELCASEVPLEEYFVLCLHGNDRLISGLLKILPPMPTCGGHLKRIKCARILVQPSHTPLDDALLESLRAMLGEEPVIERVEVPAKKPITRRQFEWAKQRWPTAFHPDKPLEALLDGTFFSAEQQETIFEFCLRAEKIGNGGTGCVIVDLDGKVVAESGERDRPLGHAVMSAVADLCECHRIHGSDVLQYLGTGFDVYLTDEPCSMCAMALVHFRVGRVFYAKRSPKGGALESSWRIQEAKTLNHHYRVFRIDEIS